MASTLGPAKRKVGPLVFWTNNPVRQGAGISAVVTCFYDEGADEHCTLTPGARRIFNGNVRLDKAEAVQTYSADVIQQCATKEISLPENVSAEAIAEALGDMFSDLDFRAAPAPLDMADA
jgi:hypothetical protein